MAEIGRAGASMKRLSRKKDDQDQVPSALRAPGPVFHSYFYYCQAPSSRLIEDAPTKSEEEKETLRHWHCLGSILI